MAARSGARVQTGVTRPWRRFCASPRSPVVVAVVIVAIGEASRTDDASREVAPAPTTSDPMAADLARCRDVTAEQMASTIPAAASGRRTAAASLRQTTSRLRRADGRHRRHRSFPRSLHPLHRFRVRPVERRGRVSRDDLDRHRHHARCPVLELGRRRGHHRAAGEEDAVRRRLRLHHRQLERAREDRVRELRRPRPEGVRHRILRRRSSASRPRRAGRARCRTPDPGIDLRPDGLHRLLRELHPDRRCCCSPG